MRTRSAAAGCIVRTVSVGADPQKPRSQKFDKKRFDAILSQNKLEGRFAAWNLV